MSIEEPRSFAPLPRRRHQRDELVKVDPVPEAGATTDQIARGVNQVHKCLEAERRTSGKHLRQVRQLIGGPGDVPSADPDQDSLFARLKRVESGQRTAAKWFDRAKTTGVVLGVVLPAFGAILWWLEGARITHLLVGH